MGIFPIPPPNTVQVNMVLDDPWIIPSPKQVASFGESMPLTPVEINYCEIISASNPPPADNAPLSMALEF